MCSCRTGEGVHYGDKQDEARVSTRVHEAGDERQEDAEGPKENAEQ